MPFIVPGVARYTINATYAGRPVANVLDFRIDTTGTTTDRADAVEAQAGIIINEWSDHVLNWAGSLYQAQSVSWVDLDDADGSTGVRSSTSQETWPQAGADTQSQLPGNVSMLWTKNAAGGRASRNGRMFLVGVIENATQALLPNTLSTAFHAARVTDANSFLGNVNQEDALDAFQSAMVVVQITSRAAPEPGQSVGAPLTGIGRTVTSLSVSTTVATQRRRLRS